MKTISSLLLTLSVAACLSPVALASDSAPAMDAKAKPAEADSGDFKTDPKYSDAYDADEQRRIYGDKKENHNPRPPIEWGRRIYDTGPISASGHYLGASNPTNSQFLLYGDARLAVARNEIDDPAIDSDGAVSQVAARLNLEADWQITATERIHVSYTPLEDDGRFTRSIFSAPNDDDEVSEVETDHNIDAAFFEGDLGAIVAGVTGHAQSWDLPFAIGRVPLQFHNGIWLDDAFTGMVFTLPAGHSKALDISNYDLTFFGGSADWNSPLLADATAGGNIPFNSRQQDKVSVFGFNAFVEANRGYWELGFARTKDDTDAIAGFDQSYNSIALSFTRRYGSWLSNSLRIIASQGQDTAPIGFDNSADGTLFIIENSFVTSSPSTFIPYLNLFYGLDRPQSLARGAGTGGLLRNVGILFESDGLTGYPTLNDSAFNTYGIAVGIESLFALDQQVVVELAAVDRHDDEHSGIDGAQYGLGVRYQRPFLSRWIFRADAMIAQAEKEDGDSIDLSGVRAELRMKF
ncbi:hypothetical protein HPT27_01945 [Permianibacter sp. IMCC34836]|uniref:hypothetical protein n=1 Tax=Permianibacter fluminis TaxID=2738515 RepID=UPI0015561C05|nr:hypothetical protein [Permianibacter fluminis]NQD35764.1 hypothetical protein [Permianibacter fluminis]